MVSLFWGPSILPGLNYKAQFLSSNLDHGDIWAVSETHLTTHAMQSFRSSLRFHNSKFTFCVGGHPVSQAGTNGRWKGVAVLAAHPTRAIPHTWPDEVFASSRTLLAATLLHDVWITGGVIYGEPDGHLHPNHRMHNEVLLQHVAGHVCHLSKGLRYVAGDLNEEFNSLPSFQLLHDAGFKDLQTLALERFGHTVSMTCKGKTRKDFCFISPELQDLLIGVNVLQDVCPDHAVLQGRFASPRARAPSMRWFVPSAFPWPQSFQVQSDFWTSTEASVTDKYSALWRHLESCAAEVVPFPIQKHAFGRGQTHATRPAQVGGPAPLRKPRRGEFAPHFHGASRRHSCWVRQVRRFQAFVRFRSSTKLDLASDQAACMWHAILSAKGFDGTFMTWWASCQYLTPGAPRVCPAFPPPGDCAVAMFETMVLATRSLEKELCKASRQYARLRRAKHPDVIFRDVKEPCAGGPELLARSLTAQIEVIDLEHNMIVLDRAQDWTDQPILCNGTELPVIRADNDGIWVESLNGVQVGMSVCQLCLKGSLAELSHEFLTTWKQRWQRHANVPPDRWDAILSFVRHRLPAGSFQWPSMDVTLLARAIQSKRSTTAGGPDGVCLADLRSMPSDALSNFCQMFAHAEHTGEWPQQVVAGRVSSIAKTACPKSALDFRPITVLGLLYRCWSSYHAHIALRQLDCLLPVGLAGSRPNKFAGQLWSGLLWDIEQAYSDGSDLGGVIADIQKAFNHLPRLAVMEICAHIGLPGNLLLGWAGALTTMGRRFQLRDHVTEPLYSNTGFPEGCALSCLAMMVLDWSMHIWFKHTLPLARPLTYVDDWQIPHH